jgi:hypothetical protein
LNETSIAVLTARLKPKRPVLNHRKEGSLLGADHLCYRGPFFLAALRLGGRTIPTAAASWHAELRPGEGAHVRVIVC